MLVEINTLYPVAKTLARRWQVNNKIRWYAWIGGRWVPMTPLFKAWLGLEECHTYRAQGGFEMLGLPVRRVGPRKSRRLQRQLRRRVWM